MDGMDADEAYIEGTCEDMCPVSERERRALTGELNVFERVDPEDNKVRGQRLGGADRDRVWGVVRGWEGGPDTRDGKKAKQCSTGKHVPQFNCPSRYTLAASKKNAMLLIPSTPTRSTCRLPVRRCV